VTGATGFIGRALVGRLAQLGIRTICAVRPESPRAAALAEVQGIELMYVDTSSRQALSEAFRRAPIENVIHLAAPGVALDHRDPLQLIDGHAGLVARMLLSLGDSPLVRFVHIGSCSEYAPAPPSTFIPEEHSLASASVYGAAKASASLIGASLARSLGLPFVTLRLFGTYGIGEAPSRLLPYLIDRLGRGEMTELTDGMQVRDLTYIDDMVDAILIATEKKDLVLHRSYNACSGVPVRIRDAVELTARVMKQPASLLGFGRLSQREDESSWIVGDPSRFLAATGWRPRLTLEEGIAKMVASRGTALGER
jgi:nucleoside-diphosphate-sugar epimerase